MADTYDLIVLGSGPGGYVAAIRAAQLGLKTAIVERENLGGICLNWGCIPTKALLRSAEIFHYMQHAKDYGLVAEKISADIEAVVKRSRGVAKQLNQGVTHLMKKNKITEIDGYGVFTDAKTIKVDDREITFDNVIIDTGSTVKLLPGVELSDNVVTYETQILTRDLPTPEKRLAGAAMVMTQLAELAKS